MAKNAQLASEEKINELEKQFQLERDMHLSFILLLRKQKTKRPSLKT
jgi:hypothetical protein